jgi:hypothetical protein
MEEMEYSYRIMVRKLGRKRNLDEDEGEGSISYDMYRCNN